MNYLLLFFTLSAYSADFYIKSLKAPLLEEAKNGSKIKSTLDRGTQVSGIGDAAPFVNVKLGNETGYVNKLFLSDKPIEGKNSLLNQDVDISSKARKRASGFTSAAAARGLKEDSDDIFKSLTDADPEQVKIMESWKVSESEGLTFLSDPSAQLVKDKK